MQTCTMPIHNTLDQVDKHLAIANITFVAPNELRDVNYLGFNWETRYRSANVCIMCYDAVCNDSALEVISDIVMSDITETTKNDDIIIVNGDEIGYIVRRVVQLTDIVVLMPVFKFPISGVERDDFIKDHTEICSIAQRSILYRKFVKEDEKSIVAQKTFVNSEKQTRKGKNKKMKNAQVVMTEHDTPVVATNTINISLSDINTIDKRFQVRKEIDSANVTSLSVANLDSIPPIKVVQEGVKYVIVSGFHRYQAYLKRAEVPVSIKAILLTGMTDSELILLAYADNSFHGLPLTIPEKKKHAIAFCLAHPEVPHYKVAPLVGLTDKTITEVMKQHNTKEHQKAMTVVSEQPEVDDAKNEEVKKEEDTLKKLEDAGKLLMRNVKRFNELGEEDCSVVIKALLTNSENKQQLEWLFSAYTDARLGN